MQIGQQYGSSPDRIPEYIKSRLRTFTGLDNNTLDLFIKRSKKYPDHKKEWALWDPKTEQEIDWFYYTSKTYLFANAIHKIPHNLYNKVKKEEKVLDFGGGAGAVSLSLSILKDCEVFYYDINLLQQKFLEHCSKRDRLKITVLTLEDNSFIPQLKEKVSVATALDVLEHIPNYPFYIKLISEALEKNGSFYVFAPFGSSEPSHFDDKHNLNSICLKYGLQLAARDGILTIYKKV